MGQQVVEYISPAKEAHLSISYYQHHIILRSIGYQTRISAGALIHFTGDNAFQSNNDYTY